MHRAVVNSQAFRELNDLKGRKTIRAKSPKGRTYTYDVDEDYVDYLLNPDEVFARTYAQYVAMRSDDATLKKQLMSHTFNLGATKMGGELKDSLHYPRQWKPDDFTPIAEALDHLFETQGWIQKLVNSQHTKGVLMAEEKDKTEGNGEIDDAPFGEPRYLTDDELDVLFEAAGLPPVWRPGDYSIGEPRTDWSPTNPGRYSDVVAEEPPFDPPFPKGHPNNP